MYPPTRDDVSRPSAVAVASANRLAAKGRLTEKRRLSHQRLSPASGVGNEASTASSLANNGASTGATAGAAASNEASIASSVSSSTASATIVSSTNSPDALLSQPSFTKKKRINWGKSPHCDALQKAITDWDNQDGSYFDENGEGITDYKVFATLHGIPSHTFYKYIHPDRNKRRKLGDGFRGKPRALTNDDVKFFGEVFARADRGNDGLSMKEAVDAVIEYVPGISRRGARQQLGRHILPKNAAAGVLKKTLQKVQATTSDRTNINLPQQFRQMASAMAEINAQEADDALKKKQENEKESAELAPASARKLEANGRNIAKCTVKEIYSLLVTIYNINLTGSKLRKPDFVTRLENEITRDTGRYERYIATLNDASASGAAQQEHADDEVEPANDIAVQQADNEEQSVVEEEAV